MRKLVVFLILVLLLSGCGSALGDDQVVVNGIDPAETNTQEDVVQQADPQEEPEEHVIEESALAASKLANLPIDEFFSQGFDQILLQDPELILELGIHDLSVDEPILKDVSPEALNDKDQFNQELLELLHEYDYASLNKADQISYQVFEWNLREDIRSYQDRMFTYLVNPMSVRSEPQLYVMFFTDTHPFNSAQDAEDYVARVSLLDEKIDQLIIRINEQTAMGMIPPRIVLQTGRSDFKRAIGSTPSNSPIRTSFRTKARDIPDLDPDTFDSLDEALGQVLREEVYPAFDRLNDLLIDLEKQAPDVLGLSAFPGGKTYYQRQLRHFTTTELMPEEIHEMGLKEIERIQAEMRTRFSELGYPLDESIPELYKRLIADSGTLRGEEITIEYERILAEADSLVAEYFIQRPAGALEVVGGDVGGFYSPGSMDGTRPGRFYARITSPEPTYKMRSLAYHEGIPGHHFQISIAAMADLPLFRNFTGFDGYTEGWALYAEYLAYDLGWYADDPYGDLGRLQYEVLRACRMVVDTGIHAMGWEYQQAVDYMVENTGFDHGFMEYEVMRYISYPAQATAYMVGKSEIQRLRAVAEEALGPDFVLSEFHTVILENGSMPLSVLEVVIREWIEGKGS